MLQECKDSLTLKALRNFALLTLILFPVFADVLHAQR